MRSRWTLASAAATGALAVAVATGATTPAVARTAAAPSIFRVRTRSPLVALSFDDGPDPRWTPAVLAILGRRGAQATFFVSGDHATAHRDLIAAEVSGGNELGDHTWDHPHLLALSADTVAAEIATGAGAIATVAGQRPSIFRPPYGETSALVNALAAKQGMRTVLWGACLEAWIRRDGLVRGVRNLVESVGPGAIILAHDGGVPNRALTMAALPRLLVELQADGFKVVSVGELLRAASRRSAA